MVAWIALSALISLTPPPLPHSQNVGRAAYFALTLFQPPTRPQSTRKKPQGKPESDWKNLFDGKSLDGWKRTEFSGGGEVHLEKNFREGPAAIVVDSGVAMSGFNYTGKVPTTHYEIALETMKINGSDFLCGLTFPVDKSYASLILGGWGGATVGISSIDNQDASENPTTQYINFERDRWYKVRVRVTPAKLEVWLDDKQIVDQTITGKKISLRPGEIDRSIPLGVATYQTSAAYRAIKLRRLEAKPTGPKQPGQKQTGKEQPGKE